MDANQLRAVIVNPGASDSQRQAAADALATMEETPASVVADSCIAAIVERLERPKRREQAWADIKSRLPASEWRAEWERITTADPSLAFDDANPRQSFEYWATVCETREPYDVKIWLLRHVIAIRDRLPEFAFQLREEIQSFITRQERRWKPV
jgi:hypothetical protein